MRFVLPFFDDSTLIFASNVKSALVARGHDVFTWHLEGYPEISERQMRVHLPEGSDISAQPSWIVEGNGAAFGFDAIILCKADIVFRRALEKKGYRESTDRPAFVAFFPGLDYTPARGMENRRNFDVVFLTKRTLIDSFNAGKNTTENPYQHVSFGHPYFMIQENKASLDSRKDIYFFVQAITPSTLNARCFIIEILQVLALRNPDRRVVIKLRHLENENADHVHKELFSYPSLAQRYFPNLPENVVFSDESMREALSKAAYCLTCTSTSAMDAISAGVPVGLYTDYVENYCDQYVSAAQEEFKDSNLLMSIPDIMEFRYQAPRSDWLEDRFRSDDLYEELENVVETFRQRRYDA